MPTDSPGRSASKRFEADTGDYAARGLLRTRRALEPATAPHVQYKGRSCINFCSNDYLGLAGDNRIAATFKQAVDRYGVGAGASQLVSGYSDVQAELENTLAEYCGYERALVFSNGYMANIGAITALCDRSTVIHIDRLAHASLIDAAILARARMRRFAHNDTSVLENNVSKDNSSKKIVITEGVFSMEGDCADVSRIADISRSGQALLYLDDAHAFGVMGEQGRGSRSQNNLSVDDVPIMMATFGKALGVSGAFVAGSSGLMETILQQARTLIYTTAPPPALAAATLKSLAIVQQEQWRRDKLQELIAYWRSQAQERGLSLLDSRTAIQPLMIGANDKTTAISNALLEQGLLISAIRPPTVPEGGARLRITLTAAHEKADIDRLIAVLTAVL